MTQETQEMAKKPKITEAMKFAAGPRGQLIISRALHVLIQQLNSVASIEQREVSDLSDARYIMNRLYAKWIPVHVEHDEVRKEIALINESAQPSLFPGGDAHMDRAAAEHP